MPKGYWLATYKKIENKDNLGDYAKKATETIKSYGGQPLVRGGKYKCLEGNEFSRIFTNNRCCFNCVFFQNFYTFNFFIYSYPNSFWHKFSPF